MKRNRYIGLSVLGAAALRLAAAGLAMPSSESAVTLSVVRLPPSMQVGLESDDPVSLLLRIAHPDGLQAWRLADAGDVGARRHA